MKCIFLDESGDLGFGKKSSKYLVISLLVCDIKVEQEIRRIIKKIRQRILKKKLRRSPEIKWNNSSDKIRFKILTKASEKNIEIFSVILDKSKVYDYLKDKKHKLYNYLCNLILNECVLDEKIIYLFVDRSKTKRSLRDDFDEYIRFKLKNLDCNIKIKHEDSKNNGGLQVLDFICGAIFNKYEFKNKEYYDIIKNLIVTERKLFVSGP